MASAASNQPGWPTDLRRHGHRGGADTTARFPSGVPPGRRLHPLGPAFAWVGDRRARPLNPQPAQPRLCWYAILVENQRIGEGADLQQAMPVGVIPCQADTSRPTTITYRPSPLHRRASKTSKNCSPIAKLSGPAMPRPADTRSHFTAAFDVGLRVTRMGTCAQSASEDFQRKDGSGSAAVSLLRLVAFRAVSFRPHLASAVLSFGHRA
jgi:hypothetical protein